MSSGVSHFRVLEVVIHRASYNQTVVDMVSTLGVDQFSFGTIEPLRRDISRVRRAVKSANGSGS